jgi:hypothetical protein
MSNVFTSLTDLRIWVNDQTSGRDGWGSIEREEVVRAIRRMRARPNWNEDWREFLDSLPDLGELAGL